MWRQAQWVHSWSEFIHGSKRPCWVRPRASGGGSLQAWWATWSDVVTGISVSPAVFGSSATASERLVGVPSLVIRWMLNSMSWPCLFVCSLHSNEWMEGQSSSNVKPQQMLLSLGLFSVKQIKAYSIKNLFKKYTLIKVGFLFLVISKCSLCECLLKVLVILSYSVSQWEPVRLSIICYNIKLKSFMCQALPALCGLTWSDSTAKNTEPQRKFLE